MATPPSTPPTDDPDYHGVSEPAYEDDERRLIYRGTSSDPTFGYLLGLALSIGLSPLTPEGADMRYALVWLALAGFAVLAWLLGTMKRIDQERPEDLAWGIIFGLILAAPLLFAGGETLTRTVDLLFRTEIDGQLRAMPQGMVLMLLVFVMPTAETLFFRGLMQYNRAFWLVGLLASLWSILLFFPMLDVARFPIVAVIIGTALTMMNLLYSYVCERNGLAAAWLCQIVVNVALLFIPYISS